MVESLVGSEILDAQSAYPVAHITLRRADKKNAITPAMLEQLIVIVDGAEKSNARAIVLAGVSGPGGFCSGFDVKLCHQDETALPGLLRGLSRAIVALRRSPLPVVIGAHGQAIAGGAALLGGADIVVASSDLRVGYPVLRLGLSPAVSGPFLRQSVGDGRAREWVLGGEVVDAEAARREGLAHEVVHGDADGSKTIARAIAIARDLAAMPGAAVRSTKSLLNELDGSLDEKAIESALAASLSTAGSAEQHERLGAFLARKQL